MVSLLQLGNRFEINHRNKQESEIPRIATARFGNLYIIKMIFGDNIQEISRLNAVKKLDKTTIKLVLFEHLKSRREVFIRLCCNLESIALAPKNPWMLNSSSVCLI